MYLFFQIFFTCTRIPCWSKWELLVKEFCLVNTKLGHIVYSFRLKSKLCGLLWTFWNFVMYATPVQSSNSRGPSTLILKREKKLLPLNCISTAQMKYSTDFWTEKVIKISGTKIVEKIFDCIKLTLTTNMIEFLSIL